METKGVSQRLKVVATPPSLVGSVSVGISLIVTPGGDRVAVLDVDLIAVEGIKLNPRKWVKKRKC